jgi:hypothetical protein
MQATAATQATTVAPATSNSKADSNIRNTHKSRNASNSRNERDNRTANTVWMPCSKSRHAVKIRDDSISRKNNIIMDVISSRPPE